jgi:hypothetical protein
MKNLRFRDRFRPEPSVIVASYRSNRRAGIELSQYLSVSDISCMHDVIASMQKRYRLGPQQTVSVRNETYAWHDTRLSNPINSHSKTADGFY